MSAVSVFAHYQGDAMAHYNDYVRGTVEPTTKQRWEWAMVNKQKITDNSNNYISKMWIV